MRQERNGKKSGAVVAGGGNFPGPSSISYSLLAAYTEKFGGRLKAEQVTHTTGSSESRQEKRCISEARKTNTSRRARDSPRHARFPVAQVWRYRKEHTMYECLSHTNITGRSNSQHVTRLFLTTLLVTPKDRIILKDWFKFQTV